MEFSNTNIIGYNTNLNKLKMEKESWTSKICKFFFKNKIISVIVCSVFIFSFVNIFMIYQFVSVLKNVY